MDVLPFGPLNTGFGDNFGVYIYIYIYIYIQMMYHAVVQVTFFLKRRKTMFATCLSSSLFIRNLSTKHVCHLSAETVGVDHQNQLRHFCRVFLPAAGPGYRYRSIDDVLLLFVFANLYSFTDYSARLVFAACRSITCKKPELVLFTVLFWEGFSHIISEEG